MLTECNHALKRSIGYTDFTTLNLEHPHCHPARRTICTSKMYRDAGPDVCTLIDIAFIDVTNLGPEVAEIVADKVLGKVKVAKEAAKKVDLGPPAPNRSTLFPEPHAGDSIPASSTGRAKAAEQRQVNDIMSDTGCHTCGTKNPGTTSGNAIGDHQPPTGLNTAGQQQRLFPHCDSCSRSQAGQVTQEIRRRGGN